MEIKNICCLGPNYLGCRTMSVIALKCREIKVSVVNLNKARIAAWSNENLDNLPVYEPRLAKVVGEARGRNLFFSINVDAAKMIFTATNTPTKTNGEVKGMAEDLKFVELCARQIACVTKNDKIIVEKSTLSVRTAETLQTILDSISNGVHFAVLSNPEFLTEVTAIEDLVNVDKVLIAGKQTAKVKGAILSLVKVYTHWLTPKQILTTNVWSSKLSKWTANTFLAQRISSINTLSALCEVTEANVNEVANAIRSDSRIGPKFLKASVKFAGSCFQKDILNLANLCRYFNLPEVAHYWERVIIPEIYQKSRFAKKNINSLFKTVSDEKITFLGWAFKNDTNDTRESTVIYDADQITKNGARIHAYLPKVSETKINAVMSY